MIPDILIVDDEADIRDLLAGLLEDEGYPTRRAADSTQAFRQIEVRRPGLVVLDIWLQGSELDGMQILLKLKEAHPDLPVVMISGHGNIETAVGAIKQGAYDFIEKPFKSDHLLMTVARALEAGRMRRELADLRARLGSGGSIDLSGRSPAMQTVLSAIERVAPSNSRVMITGPAGAGKEVAARRIHALSPRADQPFVILNCATMRPETLEQELFGLEPDGGPVKPGILERADGGVLFLDEVADMPHETQGKITRVLQDQVFLRVGGTEPVKADIRILSASNKDLKAEIKAGRFREDLFFHLRVVPIEIPGLAERPEDVAGIAADFMAQAVLQSGGGSPRPFAEDALAAMQSYDWPGNVRQLKNAVDWLMIMAPGRADEPIRADMLPPEITGHVQSAAGIEADYTHLGLRQAREVFEREYLEAQIRRFGGNVTKTAAFIGMERSALHRKLKSLGVWPPLRRADDAREESAGRTGDTAGITAFNSSEPGR